MKTKKGNVCRGFRPSKKKKKCQFGRNKNNGDCLKNPRRKK